MRVQAKRISQTLITISTSPQPLNYLHYISKHRIHCMTQPSLNHVTKTPLSTITSLARDLINFKPLES